MGKTLLSLWGLKPPDPPAPVDEIMEDATKSTCVPLNFEEPAAGSCALRESSEQLRDANVPVHGFFAPPKSRQVIEDTPKVVENKELTPRPSVMCTLRASPDRLSAIKPRVHGFFQKKVALPPSELSKELRQVVMPSQPACWPKFQSRPERSDAIDPLPRRKRAKTRHISQDHGSSGPATRYGPKLPSLLPHLSGPMPTRKLMKSEEARQVVSVVKPEDDPLLSKMRINAGNPQPFDSGDWETQMWCTKYAPTTVSECINARAGKLAYRWLKRQMRLLKNGPIVMRRVNEMNDFIDEGNASLSYLLLHGPSGMGKTATVYAAARDLGAFVFEINSSQKRGGKEVLSLLEGIGHSRAVHNNSERKDCIILIDDVDVLYESEASFFSTLDRVAQTTRRPIVLTCQDLDRLPYSVLDTAEHLYIGAPDPVRSVEYSWLVAFCEGHQLSKEVVAHTVVRHNGDIRKALTHLQFWCQMGIGGRPSGSDWLLTEPGYDRVISVGTPVKLPETHGLASSVPITGELTEMLSLLDAQYRPRTYHEPYADGLQGIPEPGWVEVFEHPEYVEDPFPQIHRRSLRQLRDTLWYGHNDKLLVLDYAPYARQMALADRMRNQILAETNSGRQSRRSWAARGLDGRQHLSNGEQILKCGWPGQNSLPDCI